MPDKPRTTRQQAWIEAMLTGVTPTEAARIAKYAHGTEKQRGHENVTNRDLMAEIDKRKADLRKETGYTVHQAQLEFEEARQIALAQKNPASMVSATAGKARLYGYDKQTMITEHVPAQPTGAEAEATQEAARAYKLRLAGSGTGLASPTVDERKKQA